MTVTFQEDGHRYFVDGRELPTSMTKVLKELNLYGEWLDWNAKPHHRDFGSSVHRAIMLYHKGTIVWGETHPRVTARCWGWYHFLESTGFQPIMIEHPVVICGIVGGALDLYGAFPDGSTAIIDVKGAPNKEPAYKLQTAGYRIGLRQTYGIEADLRMCVYLKDDGFVRETHDDPSDERRVMEVIDLWKWKYDHGKVRKERRRNA